MHERSLAQNIIRIANDHVPADKRLFPIKSIQLQIGEMQQVVLDSLRFYFEALTAGTPLASAKLEIKTTPLCGRCQKCGQVVTFNQPPYVCQTCGSNDMKMETGFELKVVSVEVED